MFRRRLEPTRLPRGGGTGRRQSARRGGLTLVELLIATSVMVLLAGAMAALAMSVHLGFGYTLGHGEVAQHARVALERIERTVAGAAANGSFPGALVVAENDGGWRFPDTLVVWHPSSSVLQANPGRLPLSDPTRRPHFDELVIFTPSADAPNELLEITVPDDARLAPSADELALWQSEISALKSSHSGNEVVLTDLLRTAVVSGPADATGRGAIRFEVRLRPSEADWAAYQADTLSWDRLPWVQGIYSRRTGLRQAWVRIEMQLVPRDETEPPQAEVFFGSAAVLYTMHCSG